MDYHLTSELVSSFLISVKFQIKIRGKVALGTSVFLGLFLLFLILSSIQFDQENLREATIAQANSTLNAIKQPIQKYYKLIHQIELLKKHRKVYLNEIKKNPKQKSFFKKKVKGIDKKIKKKKELAKAAKKTMISIYDPKRSEYQVQLTSKSWRIVFHSHVASLTGFKLNPRSKANQSQNRIISAHKKESVFSVVKKNSLLTQSPWGYLNYDNPVYADEKSSDLAFAVLKVFSWDSLKKTKLDLEKIEKEYVRIMFQLEKFEIDWFKEKWKEGGKLPIFKERNFAKNSDIKKTYQEFKKLKKKRKKIDTKVKIIIKKKYAFRIDKLKIEFKEYKRRIKQSISAVSKARRDYKKIKKDKKAPNRLSKIKKAKKQISKLQEELQTIETQKETIRIKLYIHLIPERNRLINGVGNLAKTFQKSFAPFAKGWDKKKSFYKGYFQYPTRTSGQILRELFQGVIQLQIFEYDKTEKSHSNILKQVDLGISLLVRGIFLAFFLATFFVKDIKRLAKTANLVGSGDLSATFQVSSKDELSDLANTFNEMLRGVQEREELRSEIKTAGLIQKNLLPHDISENIQNSFDFNYIYHPMIGVGGDYIDIFEVSKEVTFLAIGDVSNHGVGPGLVMTMVRSFLRAAALHGSSLVELAQNLNENLYQDTPSNVFVSLFICFLNNKTGELNYISCGHNDAYILGNGKVKVLPAQGMALGAMSPLIYDSSAKEYKINLKKHEFLFQYTDGLTEAFDQNGQQLGDARLQKALQVFSQEKTLTSKQIIQSLVAVFQKFTALELKAEGTEGLTDDIAMFAIAVKSK